MLQSTLNEIKSNLLYILDEIQQKRQYLNKHFQNSMNNYFLENYATLPSLKQRYDTQSGRQVRKEVSEKYNTTAQFGSQKGFLKCFLLMKGFAEEHRINNSLKDYRKSLVQIANHSQLDNTIQKGSLEWITIQWRRLFALMVLHHTFYPEISGVYELWFHIFDERLVSRQRQKKEKGEVICKQGKAPYIISSSTQASKLSNQQKQNRNKGSLSSISCDDEEQYNYCFSDSKSISQIINLQNNISLGETINEAEIKLNNIQNDSASEDTFEPFLTKKRNTEDTIIILRNKSNENLEISRNNSSYSIINSVIENQQCESYIENKMQSKNYANKISNFNSSSQYQNQLMQQQGYFETQLQLKNQTQEQHKKELQFKHEYQLEEQKYLNQNQKQAKQKYFQYDIYNQTNFNQQNQINIDSSLKSIEEKNQFISNAQNSQYPQQSEEQGQQNNTHFMQQPQINYPMNYGQVQQKQQFNTIPKQEFHADNCSIQDIQHTENKYFDQNNYNNQSFYEQQQLTNIQFQGQNQNNQGIMNNPDFFINCNQEDSVQTNQNFNENLNKLKESQLKTEENSQLSNNIEVNINSQNLTKCIDFQDNQNSYNSIQQQFKPQNQTFYKHFNQQQSLQHQIMNSHIQPQPEAYQYNFELYPYDMPQSCQDQQSTENYIQHSQLSTTESQQSNNYNMKYKNNYYNQQQKIEFDFNELYQYTNQQQYSIMNQYHDRNLLCDDPVLEIFSNFKNEYL